MEFRLVLRGPLPPERRRANTVPKHAVRRALHPQLKALFQQHPLLRAHLEPVGGEPSVVEQTANQNRLGRFRFVPLVDTTGACALDVLILLREHLPTVPAVFHYRIRLELETQQGTAGRAVDRRHRIDDTMRHADWIAITAGSGRWPKGGEASPAIAARDTSKG